MRKVAVVLSDIRSLHNVGSFFRTADAVGAEQIICCGITGTPKNRRLWKVSLGAEQVVPWSYSESTEIAIANLRTKGYQIVGVELSDESVPYTKAEYQDNVALVFGSETDGLSSELLAMCDTVVALPMRGQKESLNVSVTGGIVLYHILQ